MPLTKIFLIVIISQDSHIMPKIFRGHLTQGCHLASCDARFKKSGLLGDWLTPKKETQEAKLIWLHSGFLEEKLASKNSNKEAKLIRPLCGF